MTTPVPDLAQQGREALMRLDRDAAEAAFAQALEENPQSVDALVGLGQVAYERSELEQSYTFFKKAVDLALKQLGGTWPSKLRWQDPAEKSFLRALHGMGLILFRQGQPKEAAVWFEREQQLDAADHQGSHFLMEKIKAGLDWRGQ